MGRNLLQGLGDTGNQSSNGILPGRLGVRAHGTAQLFLEDLLNDDTEFL